MSHQTGYSEAHTQREPLDPDLERRIVALEAAQPEMPDDFDRSSWVWIIVLGALGPALLLLLGWFGE